MKNILISGYYGSKNGGDEAMLAAMLEVLREFDGDLNFTVISMNPEYTKKRHNVDAVAWLNVWAIIKKILSADLLISGGGSLLQNVTSRRSLYYYLGIIFLAKFFGRKVMLYAQGIGPIRGTLAHKLMNFIVNRVDLITVRDHGSLEELGRLKITRPKIFCTADPVLAIKPAKLDAGKKILSKFNLSEEKNFIGVSVRKWIDWGNCRKEMATAFDKLVEEKNAEIIFLPMQFPEDIKAAKSTAELMKKNCVVLEDEFSTSEILSLVGCMDVLISIRLHALIFAGVMNVPMLGISYDPKIERFLDSVEEKPLGNLENVTAEKIFDGVVKKIGAKKNLHNESQLKNLRESALQNARLAIKLLEEEN
ncbi:MAG: polysaccharide pyruvyl transferase CsaB [Selenomonadaceae bacterium]|nr:polysaccharide pyruvyl transferase CsaB [Selenomonadaceae bacterium]